MVGWSTGFGLPMPCDGRRLGNRSGSERRPGRRHLNRKRVRAPRKTAPAQTESITDSVMAHLQSGMSQLGINRRDDADRSPAMLDVLATSINIMQVLITRSRARR